MSGRAVETVEPATIVLLRREADLLDRIIEKRLAVAGGGRAETARAFTVREVLAAGLLAVARAEGVEP